jgi:Icc-related predicted phosphoesterase
MRVLSIDRHPFAAIEHLAAAGRGRAENHDLPVLRGSIDGLPNDLDAVIVASDLQGVSELAADPALHLLGEVVAERLGVLADADTIPARARTGMLLAVDLFSALFSAPAADVRGISGDVRPVWRAFARSFRWVAGVAGNHDTFGAGHDRGATFREPRVHVLDGQVVELDGLRVGGLGGIVGDPAKPGRRDEREFVRELKRRISAKPDVVVLHHGPDTQRGELRGHSAVRRAFDRSGPLLIVCGHVMPEPLAEVSGGALNVDSRVVVLTRASRIEG